MDLIEPEERNSPIKINVGNKNINFQGGVEIEETHDSSGTTRKVTRDLGNGMKSVEITKTVSMDNSKNIN